MLISVIICTRNRSDHLRKTLRSVHRLDCPDGAEVEIVLVDNGSTDRTADVMTDFRPDRFPVQVVRQPERGAANARNAGLRAARGDILLFTDDDVWLPPSWISAMAEPIRNEVADVVQGRIELAPKLMRTWMNNPRRARLMARLDTFDITRPRLTSANLGLSRSVLSAVPQFDPDLGPGRLGFEEDRLFGKQLFKAGARFAFVNDVSIIHHCNASRLSRDSHIRDAKKLGRSSAYVRYHWKHHFQGLRGSWLWLTAKLAQAIIRLWTLRIANWTEWHDDEGMMRWELRAIMQVYLFHQLFREVWRERTYAVPEALARRDAPTPEPESSSTTIEVGPASSESASSHDAKLAE
jgi:glycosyltransferase involved in cell wall biosynthesis